MVRRGKVWDLQPLGVVLGTCVCCPAGAVLQPCWRPVPEAAEESLGCLLLRSVSGAIQMHATRQFDASVWAKLYRRAGAQYGGPVTEHSDGFANFHTKLSHYNTAEMGPKNINVNLFD